MALEIEHTHLPIRGLNLHVAQVGKGELGTVVFLHGFPEIWYSWRHQMLAVAAAGYRAVAPDCRGYGLSDQPPEDEEVSFEDLVADVLGILDTLSVPKAFLVGKDFGAMPAYEFALQHPDRTRGVMCLGIPFSPAPAPLDILPEGFYIGNCRLRASGPIRTGHSTPSGDSSSSVPTPRSLILISSTHPYPLHQTAATHSMEAAPAPACCHPGRTPPPSVEAELANRHPTCCCPQPPPARPLLVRPGSARGQLADDSRVSTYTAGHRPAPARRLLVPRRTAALAC